MMRVSDLFLSLAQMDTEKLRAVNIAEDASRSWGKPLPTVIFDDENSDTRSSLSMDTGVLSTASERVKRISQHLKPSPKMWLLFGQVILLPAQGWGWGRLFSWRPPVQQRGDVNRMSSVKAQFLSATSRTNSEARKSACCFFSTSNNASLFFPINQVMFKTFTKTFSK